MSYKIEATSVFARQLKRLVKKYASLKEEYATLLDSLEKNPEQGSPVGRNCYKIRISISSKGKGKSGGARLISHIYYSGKKVYLLSIYDKSDQDTLTDNELLELLKQIK